MEILQGKGLAIKKDARLFDVHPDKTNQSEYAD